MEINEFAGQVRDAVEEKLGKEYRVEVRPVRKNNGIVLHGLLILTDSRNVAPTLYLEPFWEAYESGTPLAQIVAKLIKIYREDMPKVNVNMEFFRHFERVADRICYRLVRQEGNEQLLQDIPHIPFLDLAVCFFYAYSGDDLGEGAIVIHNSHVELWETNIRKLMELAGKNTPVLFPFDCRPMEQILREMIMEDTYPEEIPDAEEQESFFEYNPMWVLSNRQRIQGAACILYPNLLKQLAERQKSNLYILPSSIHEVILLPDKGMESPMKLKEMISEVNRTQVAPEEVLSDNLYYFDLAEGKVEIIS